LVGWAGRTQDHGSAATAFVQAADLIARYVNDIPRAIAVYEQALERQPTHADATARLEKLFQHTGEARRLIDLYERRIKALTRLQGEPRVIAELHEKVAGIWLEHFQRADKGVASYRAAFELDPTRVSAIYAAREIYREAGNLKAAIPLYQLEANAEPDAARRVGLLRELASIRREHAHDLAGAITSLQEALRIVPDDASVLHELATLRLEHAAAGGPDADAERREAADLLFQLAQLLGGEHALAYACASLDAAPDFEPALDYLERLAAEHNRGDLLPARWVGFVATAEDGPGARRRRHDLATAYVEAGQPKDAINCLEPLLTLGDVDAAQALVRLYRDAGRDDDAERALSISMAALPMDERLPRMQERVKKFHAAGNLERAEITATELLALDPSNAVAIEMLVQIRRGAGDLSGARDLLHSGASNPGVETPRRVELLHQVAQLCEAELGDVDGAVGAWRAIAALAPQETQPRVELLRLLEKAERWDDLVELLERQLGHMTDDKAQAALLRRIARVHRDMRQDDEASIVALNALRGIRPNDAAVRSELIELMTAREAWQSLLPLLKQRGQDEGETQDARVSAWSTLAQICETRLNQDEDAHYAASQWAALAPTEPLALDVMERVNTRLDRHDRQVETLLRRVDLAADDATRGALLRRVAELCAVRLGDEAQAITHLEHALRLDPQDAAAMDAIAPLYTRAGRSEQWVALMQDKLRLETDPARQAELRRVIARMLTTLPGREADALNAWRKVRDDAGGDAETLEALRSLLGEGNEAELADVLGALAATADGESEDDLIGLRMLYVQQAGLLDKLGREKEAAAALRAALDADPEHMPSVRRLVAICESAQDHPGLVDALERQMAITEDADLQVPIAERIIKLSRETLGTPERAVPAYTAWITAEPTALPPLVGLAEVYGLTGQPEYQRDVLDRLVAVSHGTDVKLSYRHAREVAKVCHEKLDDAEGAYQRLLPGTLAGDEASEQALHALALATGRAATLGDLYAGMAHQQGGGAGSKARWLLARDVYAEHAKDGPKALDALLRAFALDLDDAALLDEVDAMVVAQEAYPRLEQVYETLLRRAETPDAKVALLLRHAGILESKAAAPGDALDRVLRAISLTPMDEALFERAERLAATTGRAADLLPALDKRASAFSNPADAVPAVLRAARYAATQVGDAEAAMRYVRKATSLAHGNADALGEIETLVRGMDEAAGGDTLRRALIATYRETAEFAGPKGVPALLRAADLLKQLGNATEARATVEQAVRNAPLDDGAYRALAALSEGDDGAKQLDRLLSDLIDDALDATVAGTLYRRRGELLVARGQHSEAADVFQQLLTLDSHNVAAREALLTSLEAANRHQDLTMAIEGDLRRSTDAAHKLALRKRLAAIWEGPLDNRFEALDVWKQVLREASRDEDALAAVARLEAAGRAVSDGDDEDDDLLSIPPSPKPASVVPAALAEDDAEDGDGTATETEADQVPADRQTHPDAVEDASELTNPSIALPGDAQEPAAGSEPAPARESAPPAPASAAVRPSAPPPVARASSLPPPPLAPRASSAPPPPLPPRASSAPPPAPRAASVPPPAPPVAPPPVAPPRPPAAAAPPLPRASVPPPPLPPVARPPGRASAPGLPPLPGFAAAPPPMPPAPPRASVAPPLPSSRSIPPPPLPPRASAAPPLPPRPSRRPPSSPTRSPRDPAQLRAPRPLPWPRPKA
jgi:tetratricopeptide (TPR) repeat protein